MANGQIGIEEKKPQDENILRVGRNVDMMLGAGEDESVIDEYLASEDVTAEELRGEPIKASSVVKGAWRNIPRSAGDIVSGLGNLALSAAQNVIPGEQGKEALFTDFIKTTTKQGVGALSKMIFPEGDPLRADLKPLLGESEAEFEKLIAGEADRIGGIENIKKSIIKDPVITLMDISLLTKVFGGVVRQTAKGFNKSTVGRFGEPVGKYIEIFGKYSDPLTGSAKLLSEGVNLGKEALGTLIVNPLTSKGRQAAKAGLDPAGRQGFKEGLRGTVSGEDLILKAKDGVEALKIGKASRYQENLKKLKGIENSIDIAPIKKTIDDFLENNGVKKVKETAKDGTVTEKLSFKNTAWSAATDEQAIINKVNELVKTWYDFSPIGIDRLKQAVDSTFTFNKDTRSLVSAVRAKARETLVSAVPLYDDMTKNYAKAQQLINDIETGLSLKGPKAVETVYKKLTNAFKDSNEIRTALLDELDKVSPGLKSKLAGASFSGGGPGLTGSVIRSGAALQLLDAFANGLPPNFYATGAILALTQPRLWGEFLLALSGTEKIVQESIKQISKITPSPTARNLTVQASEKLGGEQNVLDTLGNAQPVVQSSGVAQENIATPQTPNHLQQALNNRSGVVSGVGTRAR